MEKPVNMSISIRIPPSLHARIGERAAHDLRSLNSEIHWLLTFALDTLEREPADPRAEPAAARAG